MRFTRAEFDSLVRIAITRLVDANHDALSLESRFSLAYSAAHALATAALRVHGYRSGSRQLVFQCLEHTVGLSATQSRLFSLCHARRNKAEYEGRFEVDETLTKDLIHSTEDLLEKVSRMVPEE